VKCQKGVRNENFNTAAATANLNTTNTATNYYNSSK